MALFIQPKLHPEAFVKLLVDGMIHGATRRIPGWMLTSQHADITLALGDPALDRKATFRPRVEENGQVSLHLTWAPGVAPDSAVYGAYHGRFIEMLFTYFVDKFELVSAA